MIEPLPNLEPLSQVWFVLDYIQLQFQYKTVTINNLPEIHLETGQVFEREAPGFCDALVAQIGQEVAEATLEEGSECVITFANGTKIVVRLYGRSARGPEAMELPGAWIVFNA